MPETGLFDSATIAAVGGATDAPPPPWEISAAVVQQVTFEVQVPQGRQHLPDIVTRSAPMYAKLTVVDRADSPVGPYREAVLALGCRAGMLPALYVVASIVNSEAARDAIAAHWNYLPTLGEIEFERSDDAVNSTIHVADGFTVSVDSALTNAAAVAVVRYDPLLVVQPGDDGPAAQEVPATHVVSEAWMDRRASIGYTGGERSSAWLQLRSHHAITGFVAVESQTIEAAAPVVVPQMAMG